MVNTTLIFSLLLSISALTTSFAALAENSDCPPGADPDSLCQQFKVSGVVPAKSKVTGPDKLTLKRVIDKIEGETDEFIVDTNEDAKNITVQFRGFSRISKAVGLFLDGSDQCQLRDTHETGFNLEVFMQSNNDGEYIEFTSTRMPVAVENNKARFKFKFISVSDFGKANEGLEKLYKGTYGCELSLIVSIST